MTDQKRRDHVNEKQIELGREDIYAIEKPANKARLVKAPEHFVSQELIDDIKFKSIASDLLFRLTARKVVISPLLI